MSRFRSARGRRASWSALAPGVSRAAFALSALAAGVLVAACSDNSSDGSGAEAGAAGDGAGSGGRAGSSGSSGSSGEGARPSGDAGQIGSGGDPTGGGGDSSGGAGDTGGEGGAGGADGGDTPSCVAADDVEPAIVALSSSNHDSFLAVTRDADGNIYALGFVESGNAPSIDRATVVARFDADGALDPAFGDEGVAIVNVREAGIAETARGLVLQSDGKLVVAGAVETPNYDPSDVVRRGDTDLFLFRLRADGALDDTFGEDGFAFHDLNEGIEGTNSQGAAVVAGADSQWGLSVFPNDELVVFGSQRGGSRSDATPRTDSDWVVLKLDADGAPVTSFGTDGKFVLDIARANAAARTTSLLEDGAIVAAGYATYAGTQRPVIFKLTPDGELDPSFGVQGVFSEPIDTAAEAYAATLQSDGKLVTAGYGRPHADAMSADWVSIRLTPAGILDRTYGTAGRTWLDVAGFGDNARSMTLLPDDRPVLVGGGRVEAANADGVVAILTPDGQPDVTFAPGGCKTFDFGTASDFLWGAALAPNAENIALVGTTGVAQGSTDDNDAVLVLLPLP